MTIVKSGILDQERQLKKYFLIAALHDFLVKETAKFDEKTLSSILKHKARLRGEFVKAKIKLAHTLLESLNVEKEFKYVRVNQIKSTIEEVKEKCPDLIADEHIDHLILLPGNIDLSKNKLYLDGKVIIQDKASCVPAFILNPPAGSTVIDTCSAPGNKTTHLAAIMRNTGKIYAFEKDPKRFNTLNMMINRAGASIVETKNMDFLKVDPNDKIYRGVRLALVDPSCSGSGILKSHEQQIEGDQSSRLRSLSNFQCTIIRHAMKFPNLERLVYSTCSVHEEENEAVVAEILEKEPSFRLVKRPLPEWKRRGLTKYAFWEDVIRADPNEDGMHGFFVALFEKKL